MHATPEPVLAALAAYAVDGPGPAPTEIDAARACLLDSLACVLRALRDPDCARLLGPIVPGATMTCGARVPGTSYELDPVHAAFNLGTAIRWCAAGDPRASRECHPADALGALLAVADWRSRRALALAEPALTVRALLVAAARAHRIHAALAGAASDAHATGEDAVVHARIATAACATALLGGTRAHTLAAITHAFVDGTTLRPAGPEAGDPSRPVPSRERWAVGDAASRGVRHALLALAGEPACAVDRIGVAFPRVFASVGLGGAAFAAGEDGSVPAHAARVHELEAQHRLAEAAAAHYSAKQAAAIAALCADSAKLDRLAVHELVSALVRN